MHRTPPDPRLVKRDLYSIATMAQKLAVEYTQAYEAGYMGTRRNDAQERVSSTNGYSDPTGNLATATATTSTRDNNAQVASDIEQAYRILAACVRRINRYVDDADARGPRLSELPEAAVPPHEK